jgi:uncharacterized phage-associated protein
MEKITALAVANFFIEKAKSESIEMTHLKLQKLTYLAHAWHLGIDEEPLFDDDVIAWQYGPVFINIYNAFKSYKKARILTPACSIEGIVPRIKSDNSKVPFLDVIWNLYKEEDASTLINITHVIGGPWDEVYYTLGGKDLYNPAIPNDKIKTYYKKLFNSFETVTSTHH